jgi:two-component system, OmpR family, phosphate regulon sensor histidine kinase PhoR
MGNKRTFYLVYLIFVFLVFTVMVWFTPPQPELTTFWIGLNLFILIYFFPKVIKLPQIGMPTAETPQSQSQLIKVIFSQLDQFVLLIGDDGKIMEATKAWYELFDINENNEIKVNDLQKSPKLWSTINQGLATEKGAQFRWEIGHRTLQGSLFPLFIDQQFFGLLVTSFDITKINQLETIQSDFLADISHEIKTPIAAILGASEILIQSERKLTPIETKEFQQMIANESIRLQRLIHELTDLSKIGTQGFQSLIKSKFSLLEILKDVEKTHHIQIKEKNLKLVIQVTPSLNIFVDRDKFFSIFSNLLSNAIRYTDHGNITISSEVKNRSFIVYFSDTGQGIEPKNLERIFDRFYRTDAARSRVGGGTGLGLAITRAIVQAHQGTIEVTSKLGKGTTFIITIPHLT